MQTKKGGPLGAAAYVYAVHVTACACARARPLMRATGTDVDARATHIDAHSPTARRRADLRGRVRQLECCARRTSAQQEEHAAYGPDSRRRSRVGVQRVDGIAHRHRMMHRLMRATGLARFAKG